MITGRQLPLRLQLWTWGVVEFRLPREAFSKVPLESKFLWKTFEGIVVHENWSSSESMETGNSKMLEVKQVGHKSDLIK